MVDKTLKASSQVKYSRCNLASVKIYLLNICESNEKN